MGTAIDSINNMHRSIYSYGAYNRTKATLYTSSTTAADTTSGYISGQCKQDVITMPSSFGTGITKAYLHYAKGINSSACTMVLGIQYTLLTFRFVNITMTANVNNTLTVTSHGCSNGDFVRFRTTGTLPAPLDTSTNYYVINKATNTFEVSLTSGGSAIDITDTGSGTHTLSWANTPGVSMPTKTIRVDGAESSIQTATMMPALNVTTSLTGSTTPQMTITYTDQDGNTGASSSMTLPSNPSIRSLFQMAPHLASGDTGVRAITDMTSSVNGTAGQIMLLGFLPLAFMPCGQATFAGESGLFMQNYPVFAVEPNDVLNVYKLSLNSSSTSIITFSLLADV